MPASIRSRIFGWALEIIPSIGLFVFGLFRESKGFVIIGFLSLLYFAVWRMYAQFKGFQLIRSIYEKQLSATEHRATQQLEMNGESKSGRYS